MLTVYTDITALVNDYKHPNFELVRDADSYFNQLVRDRKIRIGICREVQRWLTAEKLVLRNWKDMLKLSTSCKTLVLAKQYPDLIVTTGNITTEAMLTWFVMFDKSDRAILLYPPDSDAELRIKSITPQTIINEYDKIDIEVVTESGREVCDNFRDVQEIVEDNWSCPHLENRAVGIGTGFVNKSRKIFSADSLPVEHCDTSKFDWNYNMTETYCRRLDGCKCERALCETKVELFQDCFTVGGQYIITNTFDEDLKPVVTVHTPFGNEDPTEEQLDIAFDYAEKFGFIDSGDAESEAGKKKIELKYHKAQARDWGTASSTLLNALNGDFAATHIIYYNVEGGKPYITDVMPCRDRREAEEETKWDKRLGVLPVVLESDAEHKNSWDKSFWQQTLEDDNYADGDPEAENGYMAPDEYDESEDSEDSEWGEDDREFIESLAKDFIVEEEDPCEDVDLIEEDEDCLSEEEEDNDWDKWYTV